MNKLIVAIIICCSCLNTAALSASSGPPLYKRPSTAQSYPQTLTPSGKEGTHSIQKVSENGYFIILEDGSVWKSEDNGDSGSWSSGDEVYVHNGTIVNLSENAEKVDANCEAWNCTVLAESNVKGDFEGSDKPIALDNGMIFEATTYNYDYEYRPEAIVLVSRYAGRAFYKLIIGEEIYDATRLR